MALSIDRVAVTMDVASTREGSGSPPRSEEAQREMIRGIVIDVLRTELERVMREVG